MVWKLFALAMMAFYGIGLTGSPRDILDVAGIPIDGLAAVGLLAYAFRLRRAHARWWTPYARLFAAWSVVSVAVAAIRGSVHEDPAYAITGSLLVGGALLYLNWLALYRLGRGEFA